MRHFVSPALLILALGLNASTVHAEESTRLFKLEFQVYRIATSVTGSGLNSQNLPGVDGLLHVIHQKLGDVELVMRGSTLTWDGEPRPPRDNSRITLLAAPQITTMEGTTASIRIADDTPLQYLSKTGDGLFELKVFDVADCYGPADMPAEPSSTKGSTNDVSSVESFLRPGILIAMVPRAADKPIPYVAKDVPVVGFFFRNKKKFKNIVSIDFRFVSNTVVDREKIEGVNLSVGKPILKRVAAEGEINVRLDEWACYRTPIPSRGYLYMFLKVSDANNKNVVAPKKETSTTPLSRAEIEEILKSPVGVVFEDIHLKDILEFLTDTYGLTFIIDTAAIEDEPARTESMIDYINLKNVPLGDALRAILRPLELDYSVEDGHVLVSQAD